ncbi:hypothetical protein D3C87_1971530 [compost metagenome]|uniref:hypothetical protein n=1 Tax=unclassified Paenibacillus TaxID=185978 RepID=UPI000FA19CB7
MSGGTLLPLKPTWTARLQGQNRQVGRKDSGDGVLPLLFDNMPFSPEISLCRRFSEGCMDAYITPENG